MLFPTVERVLIRAERAPSAPLPSHAPDVASAGPVAGLVGKDDGVWVFHSL